MGHSIYRLVFALLALAFIQGCLSAEYGWPPHKEYSFSIQGENLAGLPQLKQQFAGFRYQGELRVQTHSPRILLVKMLNMNTTKIHEELSSGWWHGPEPSQENKTKSFPITTSTIVVKLTKSMSPELVIQAGLDDWQVNFIKGLVSNLLVYINDNENSLSESNPNRVFSSLVKDVYSVMEDSVVGRCEVIYEVTKVPRPLGQLRHNAKLCGKQPMWEITKTRNYSNCQILNEDHARLPIRDCSPGGNNCGNFWTRSSLSQLIGCGDKNSLTLLSSVSVSVVNTQLHLQNSSQAVVNSNLNLTLLSTSELSSKFNPPQNKQTLNTLLYTYSPTRKAMYSRSCQERNDDSNEENDLSNSKSNGKGSKHNTNKNKNNRKHNKNSKDEEEDSNQNDSNEFNNSNQDSSKKLSGKKNYHTESRVIRSLQRKFSGKFNSNESSNENDDNENRRSPSNRRNVNRFSSKNNNKEDANQSSNESNDNDDRRNPNNRGNQNRFNSMNNNRRNQWSSSDDANRINSRSNNKGSNRQSSEEPNINSDEMTLEDQWKINPKEQKSVPPYQPFNMFSLAHRTSYDLSCLNPKLWQTVADIASDLQDPNILPEKNTLEKISIAVDICRSLPLDQLQIIGEEVFEMRAETSNIKKINERKVFRDIVTMCGTHPALTLMKGWIERQQVKGEEGAEMLMSFPTHVFSPTADLVQDFFEMVQQINKKSEKQLTITGMLALSNLVRDACVNSVTRQQHFSSIVTPVCDRKLASQVTQWLLEQLDSDEELTRAYIEAIGNVGSSETLKALRDIAINPKYSSYLQTSAVFAMRYQALRSSPDAAPLLLSLYHNYSLPASSRIAAVSLLAYSDPGLAMWQRLAISTYYEPSWAVQQFVASTLRSTAASKDFLYNHMTKSAFMVQPMSRPSKLNRNLPYNLVFSHMSHDLQKLVLEQVSWMRFYDFSGIYYRHSSRDSGYARANIEASLNSANPDGLWNALKELISFTNEHSSRAPARGIERSLSHIQESLDLYSRKMPPVQGELNLKINQMMQRLILLNKDSLKSLAKEGRKLVTEGLAEGISLNFQKADMSCFHISTTTEMGFPAEFSIRTPWIINSKADINASKEGITMEASFMYSSQLLSSVSVMSGWDNTAHSAGAHATNYLQLPSLRMTLSVDNATESTAAPTEALTITTSYIDQHRLVYFAMQPFTSQRRLKIHQPVLLSPDTLRVKLGETVQRPISLMNHHLNAVYTSEQKENFNPMDYVRKARMVMGFPMLMPDTEPRSFETVMNPVHPVSMNLSISMASKSMGTLEVDPSKDTIVGKIFKLYQRIIKSDDNTSKRKPSATNNEGSQESYGNSNKNKNSGKYEDSSREAKNKKATTAESSKGQLNQESNEGTENTKKNEKKSNKDKNSGKDSNERKNKEVTNRNNSQESSEENRYKGNAKMNKNNPISSEERDLMDSSAPFGEGFEVFSTTYESVAGNFNATQVDPFVNAVNGSSHSYLMEQVLDKIISGDAVVLGFNMLSSDPERPTNVSAYAAYAATYSRRANRLGLFLKKDSTEVKMTLAHEDPVDLAVDIKKRVEDDLMHRIDIDYAVKTDGKDMEVFLKAKLGASREKLEELKSSSDVEMCSQDSADQAVSSKCQHLMSQAMELGFSNITVYYNDNAKMMEKVVEKYINAAKVLLPRTEEKAGSGSNTFDVMLDINPRTQSLNAMLTTPNTSLKLYRLPLDRIPMSSIAEWALQVNSPTEFCGLSSQRVSTFDGAEMNYKLRDSWHLVARDCSNQYGVSVIAKSSGNNSMTVEVNLDDQFVIKMEEGPKVSVNGKLQPLDTSHALLRVTDRRGHLVGHTVHTPDNAIHVQMPKHHLDLVYAQSSLTIKAKAAMQGRLCGLCGSYSGSGVERMVKADGSVADSPVEFLSSYALHGSDSQSKSSRSGH